MFFKLLLTRLLARELTRAYAIPTRPALQTLWKAQRVHDFHIASRACTTHTDTYACTWIHILHVFNKLLIWRQKPCKPVHIFAYAAYAQLTRTYAQLTPNHASEPDYTTCTPISYHMMYARQIQTCHWSSWWMRICWCVGVCARVSLSFKMCRCVLCECHSKRAKHASIDLLTRMLTRDLTRTYANLRSAYVTHVFQTAASCFPATPHKICSKEFAKQTIMYQCVGASMYLYMYIRIYVNMQMCICVCTYIYIYRLDGEYIYIYTCICICIR